MGDQRATIADLVNCTKAFTTTLIAFLNFITSGVQGRVITQERNKISHLDKSLYSVELESRITTSIGDSSKLAPSTTEDIHETKLIHNDGISDNLNVINNQNKRSEGESSFSVAGPYSGHIPFSGSTSHRSDSSTTSTRSFAFPILPNEWNGSPARMAKADRRLIRKRRGCNPGLLCCKF